MPLLPEQGREFGAVRRIGAPPPGPAARRAGAERRPGLRRRAGRASTFSGASGTMSHAERRDAPQARPRRRPSSRGCRRRSRRCRRSAARRPSAAAAPRPPPPPRQAPRRPFGEGAELVGVGGEREHRRQPQRPALPPPARRDGPEGASDGPDVLAGATIRASLVPQGRRHGDRVAVEVERERRDERARGPLRPRVEAMASGASMWAPSRRPSASLSRRVAQEGSRTRSSSSPSAAAKPRSAAATRSAASVRGT